MVNGHIKKTPERESYYEIIKNAKLKIALMLKVFSNYSIAIPGSIRLHR
jgi:hypothetical protein